MKITIPHSEINKDGDGDIDLYEEISQTRDDIDTITLEKFGKE